MSQQSRRIQTEQNVIKRNRKRIERLLKLAEALMNVDTLDFEQYKSLSTVVGELKRALQY